MLSVYYTVLSFARQTNLKPINALKLLVQPDDFPLRSREHHLMSAESCTANLIHGSLQIT